MAHTVSERLDAALKKINRPGSFCVTGSVRAANPGLEVAGIGPVGLPLTAHQAKELAAVCKQAPYGKGEETLVDTSVRRVWQLDPDHFSLTNPEWDEFLRDAVATVQRDLGLEKQQLESHLYNLLLYEPGGFFLPHRDGEKLDRMVATLVVVLPSPFTGGELIVRHDGEERAIDFGAPGLNLFHTHFAAFYADCEHEVRPLRTGHRLCLVYNLTLARAQPRLAAPRTAEHVEEVAAALRGWPADGAAHKLAVPLGHQYTRDGLVWDALKGVDRVKARVLHEAATRAGCQAHLALLTLWESGAAEEDYSPRRRRRRYSDDDDDGEYEMGEVYETTLNAEHWSDPDGGRPDFGVMEVEEDEVVPPEALTSAKPEQSVSGYTGNEGLTMNRWYRHAVIVLWPNARHFDVLCDCGLHAAVAWLRQMVTGWQGARKKDPAGRDRCAALAAKVVARSAGAHCGDAEANDLLDALVALDAPELVRAFLRDVVTGSRTIKPARAVRAACEALGWNTFEAEIVGLLTATTPDPLTRVPGPGVEFLERNLELLGALCATKSRRKAGEGERVALCGRLAGLFVSVLGALDKAAAAGHDWRFRGVDRSAVLTELPRALLAVRQFDLFAAFIDRALAQAKLYPLANHIAALTALQPWLKTHLKAGCDGVSRWVGSVRQQLEVLTAQEPAPPGDFRREANIDCTCGDCVQLRRFLGDSKESVHRFRAAQDRRSHLENTIRNRGCDVDCKTERIGSPHTLVCTKNTASFRARLKKYHDDCQHLVTVREIEEARPG